ncbi:MAG: hypothetical protein AB7V36_06720 [Bacteroidales bacterium]
MKPLVTFLTLCLSLASLLAQNPDSLMMKKLVSVKKYSFPYCSINKNNCIGYSNSDFPGPAPKVSGVLIQKDSAIVIDSEGKKLLKISLLDGKIIKRSRIINEEPFPGGLREIVYFDQFILLLSDASSYFYEIDGNLAVKKNLKIPNHGTLCQFYKKGSDLYIVRENYLWVRDDSIAALSYRVNKDLTLVEDTLVINHTELREGKRIYGDKIDMYENEGLCFFQTEKFLFEIPEIIPQFDLYLMSIGFSEKYLVYFVSLDTHYEMTVCQYD